MKHLLNIFLLVCGIFFSHFANAQTYPNSQYIASPTTLFQVRPNTSPPGGGGFYVPGMLQLGNYADTAAANAVSYVKNYPGAMIRTGGENIWVRNATAVKWNQFSLSDTASNGLQQVIDYNNLLNKDNIVLGAKFEFLWNNFDTIRFNGNGIASDPAERVTIVIDTSLYINRFGVRNMITAQAVHTINLNGGATLGGVVINPNLYNASGGHVRFNHTDIDYVDMDFVSGGASPIANIGVDNQRRLLIRGVIDSGSVAIASQGRASVYIQGSRFSLAYGADTASAGDLYLPHSGNTFDLTGTTTINAIFTYAWKPGSVVYIKPGSALTFNDNTAGGAGTAPIQLSGNVAFNASAGDLLALQLNKTSDAWTEVGRSYAATANGANIYNSDGTITAATRTVTAGTSQLVINGSKSGATVSDGIFRVINSGNGVASIVATANTGTSIAVYGQANNGTAVFGDGGSVGVYGFTSVGNGVQGIASTSGTGVVGASATGLGGIFSANPATTNSVAVVMDVQRSTSGTAAAGIAGSIRFQNENTAGSLATSGQIINEFTDPINASKTSRWGFTAFNSAVESTIMSIDGSGVVGIGISSSFGANRLHTVGSTGTSVRNEITADLVNIDLGYRASTNYMRWTAVANFSVLALSSAAANNTNIRADNGDLNITGAASKKVNLQGGASNGTASVNDDGTDNDFYIKGDNDNNLVYVDAGNDRVGIGDATPDAKFTVGTTSQFQVSTDGKITLDNTITAGGTTGDRTINKPSGTVNIAAAGSAVTVTNSLVSTSSFVYAVIRTNDGTATIKNVVPASGSFTINLGAAATAEISVAFIVFN